MNPILNYDSAVQRLDDLRREGAQQRRRPRPRRFRRLLRFLRDS